MREFDEEVEQDMTAMGGPKYASLGGLTFREALAGNKLVADVTSRCSFPRRTSAMAALPHLMLSILNRQSYCSSIRSC